MSTMDLWNRVSKTDPAHVKPITGKQYSGNSPKPYYIVRRLTEEFGPVGMGWGFDIIDERMERLTEDDVLHIAKVRFWHGDKSQCFEQMGQTKACYRTGKGSMLVDEDAPKKSVTDALVKCASYLGFAGDIFSGRWDDSGYVAALKAEFAEEDAEKRRAEWISARKAEIMAAKTGGELKRIMAEALEKVRANQDGDAEAQLLAAGVEKAAMAKPKTRETEPA